MIGLSPRGQQLLAAIVLNFSLLEEHRKVQPHEVDAIVNAMVAHLRSWMPQALLFSELQGVVRVG